MITIDKAISSLHNEMLLTLDKYQGVPASAVILICESIINQAKGKLVMEYVEPLKESKEEIEDDK